ncbi:MAG: sigma 54-interacting transcriptional regulator [Deltaproteobacteria bacterium]|jgi:two-component system, NtrC family, response regulator HydG
MMERAILDPTFASLLLESMADGVFTLDKNGTITSWNPAMERISGYTAEEAIGKSCMLLNFNLCFSKKCPAGISECGIYDHGRVQDNECFLRHKDGYDIPIVKNARLVTDGSGLVRGVVETVTDLSALQKARRQAEEANLRLGEIHKLHNVIGKSRAMKEVFSAIKAAAGSDATILIQGDSGTGKELVAGAIHYNSGRSPMPFVTVNCSALAESLLESELFGHVSGAFTGAVRDRLGRFEEADGGTVFLDEIGELSPFIQVKLLRVLQEREIERVGESKKRKINIRIIAAVNKDLFSLVKGGNFREDLYYRLKVFPIQIPPLRERREDIPLLTSHFIRLQNEKTGKHIKGVLPSALRILMDYDWPGNVRELENAIEHAFVLCGTDQIDIFDLPVEIRQLAYSTGDPELPRRSLSNRFSSKRELSRQILIDILGECGWNKAEAGRRVGVSRTAIWKYMKKWDIPLKRPAPD